MATKSIAAVQDAAPKKRKQSVGASIADALAIDVALRPMVGQDIERFASRHHLQKVDVIYALCIQGSAQYNTILREDSIPFATELLIRLYDKVPGHAPWKNVSAEEAFEILYGDVLRKFAGTEHEKEARLALYRRITACFGRSVYTAYRWLESGGAESTKRGNSKRTIQKVFAKLSVLDNPREVLEAIARQMLKVRKIDLDVTYPLPTLENPPVKKRRGPIPKNRAATAEGGGKETKKRSAR